MNLSVNPKNVTVKEQEINDCPPWHRQALHYPGYDLLAVSTFLSPPALLVVISVNRNWVQYLRNVDRSTHRPCWLKWASAWPGKGGGSWIPPLLFLPLPLPLFLLSFLCSANVDYATHVSDPVPITEDIEIDESKECREQTVYARALGCTSVEMDMGSRKVDRQANRGSARVVWWMAGFWFHGGRNKWAGLWNGNRSPPETDWRGGSQPQPQGHRGEKWHVLAPSCIISFSFFFLCCFLISENDLLIDFWYCHLWSKREKNMNATVFI